MRNHVIHEGLEKTRDQRSGTASGNYYLAGNSYRFWLFFLL